MDKNDLARTIKGRFFKSVHTFNNITAVQKDEGFPHHLWHEFLNYLEGKDLGWWSDHGVLLEVFEDRLQEKHPDIYICVSLTLLHTFHMWLFKNHQDSPILEDVRLGLDRAEEFDLAVKESEYMRLLGLVN